MKTIKTNKGESIIVDDRHYAALSNFTWHIDANGYAVTDNVIRSRKEARETGLPRQANIKMHRLVYELESQVQLKTKEHIDHINQNKIDNRIDNIRLDIQGEGIGINQINQGLRKDNTTGYKGVVFRERTGRWESMINCKRKSHWLGAHETKELAALAYNEKALELFGDACYLNVV